MPCHSEIEHTKKRLKPTGVNRFLQLFIYKYHHEDLL